MPGRLSSRLFDFQYQSSTAVNEDGTFTLQYCVLNRHAKNALRYSWAGTPFSTPRWLLPKKCDSAEITSLSSIRSRAEFLYGTTDIEVAPPPPTFLPDGWAIRYLFRAQQEPQRFLSENFPVHRVDYDDAVPLRSRFRVSVALEPIPPEAEEMPTDELAGLLVDVDVKFESNVSYEVDTETYRYDYEWSDSLFLARMQRGLENPIYLQMHDWFIKEGFPKADVPIEPSQFRLDRRRFSVSMRSPTAPAMAFVPLGLGTDPDGIPSTLVFTTLYLPNPNE